MSDTPPMSKWKIAPRMSSRTTVIEQQAAADQRAHDEDEVLDRDVDHRLRLDASLGRPGSRLEHQDNGRASPGRGAAAGVRDRGCGASVGRAEQERSSQRSSGGTEVGAPSRTAAEPGASGGSDGAPGAEAERDLVRATQAVAARLLEDVAPVADPFQLALETCDLGRALRIATRSSLRPDRWRPRRR